MNPRFENWLSGVQNHNDTFFVVAVSGAMMAVAWLVLTMPIIPAKVSAVMQRVYLFGGWGMMIGTISWTVYQLAVAK